MRLGELPTGRRFHDPELGIRGKVVSQNEGSTTVRTVRQKLVRIPDEFGNVRREFSAREVNVTTRSREWEVEPGWPGPGAVPRRTPAEPSDARR